MPMTKPWFSRRAGSPSDPAALLTPLHSSLPSGNCNFSKARQVGATKHGITARVPLKTAGTFFFACRLEGHCSAGGMNVKVTIARCASEAIGYVYTACSCCCCCCCVRSL